MKQPKLFFGLYKTISLPHSNIYFPRHPKYPSVTQDPQQTSTIYIYLDNIYQITKKYQGIKIWNKMSTNLKNKSNKNFNCCYKKFLINSY